MAQQRKGQRYRALEQIRLHKESLKRRRIPAPVVDPPAAKPCWPMAIPRFFVTLPSVGLDGFFFWRSVIPGRPRMAYGFTSRLKATQAKDADETARTWKVTYMDYREVRSWLIGCRNEGFELLTVDADIDAPFVQAAAISDVIRALEGVEPDAPDVVAEFSFYCVIPLPER